MKYRGYYVDGVVFNSKKEIDEFILKSSLEQMRRAWNYFINHTSFESSIQVEKIETYLVEQCGLTWAEIEEYEIMFS